MPANDKQFGGGHYKGTGYEYWDFAQDVGLGYIDGCAGKYIYRWPNKGGLLDLEKADHYLEKCVERGVTAKYSGVTTERALEMFVQINKLGPEEAEALVHICRGNHGAARRVVEGMMARQRAAN